ncbi:hypothetical protein [Streptomyces sp. SID11385]|uniref:hypothetical protein n=1 Tax=Streptomyces sp. SID11385 TaxID=2706031 RepID=UPI0013C9D909|nr:hypothetical protein [Streptomyces sp. SID11385]NEA40932.1 hypothetical protein [Streptomyces sp. SID11385]
MAALEEFYPGIQPDQYSRYKNGIRTPPKAFAEALYLVAKRNCPPQSLPLTLDELLDMREKAEKSRNCESCEEAWATADTLAAENKDLREQLMRAGLSPEGQEQTPSEHLPGQRQDTQLGTTDSSGHAGTTHESSTLPVRGGNADRQRGNNLEGGNSAPPTAASSKEAREASRTAPAAGGRAGQFARRLLDRMERGEAGSHDTEAALSLALDTAASMTAVELCEATSLLRSADQEPLADALVTTFARQHEPPVVMAAALALQQASADKSLTLLLTAAARRKP